VGVTSVTRRAACFLVSHECYLSCKVMRQPAEMELIFTRVRDWRCPRLR
jgi:hypothetical protein